MLRQYWREVNKSWVFVKVNKKCILKTTNIVCQIKKYLKSIAIGLVRNILLLSTSLLTTFVPFRHNQRGCDNPYPYHHHPCPHDRTPPAPGARTGGGGGRIGSPRGGGGGALVSASVHELCRSQERYKNKQI